MLWNNWVYHVSKCSMISLLTLLLAFNFDFQRGTVYKKNYPVNVTYLLSLHRVKSLTLFEFGFCKLY